ncbi:MAG: protein translocase subunit SecD [Gemmatimonadaceae bacterium]|nr:protein translocase subunit SecD [Gemmatimonadaceae bacterium]
MSLKYRILLIVGLALASLWALFPRTVIERSKRDGQFVLDTVRRVPLKRGLDLQGGMHLRLVVDESKGAVANKDEAIDRAIKVVRTRIDEFGVAEPVVQKAGDDAIIVELPGIDDPDRATAVVQKSAFLEFQITDETQAMERILPRLDDIARTMGVGGAAAVASGDTAQKTAVTGLFGKGGDSTAKADSAATPADSAKAAAPPVVAGLFTRNIQAGQIPGQYVVDDALVPQMQQVLSSPAGQTVVPPGKVIRWGADTVGSLNGKVFRSLYMLDARPIITGEYLTDAKPATDPVEGNLVQFTLNNEGGRRFKNETGKHVQDFMAVVLDQRVMTAPRINQAIGTRGQITMGGGTMQDAQDLALVLRAGALPVPLKVDEVREIGASLGQDSITKGTTAMLLAVALVIITMVVYYRFSGLLAVAALVLYILYTLAALAGFDAVLTLPGLAGFVLSIGIAVDANVLIFERIREELVHGKTVRLAIDEGFRHAFSAIVDTSVATILSSAVLYQYGTGPVRGFAVTLIAGLVASLFTAIFVVRTFYMIWLTRAKSAEALSI